MSLPPRTYYMLSRTEGTCKENVEVVELPLERMQFTDGLLCPNIPSVIQWSNIIGCEWIFDAIIPEDAELIVCGNTAKANKMQVKNKRHIKDLIATLSNAECIDYVTKNNIVQTHVGQFLKYISPTQQTPFLYMQALEHTVWDLRKSECQFCAHADHPGIQICEQVPADMWTLELAIAAVTCYAWTFSVLPKHFQCMEEICLAAIRSCCSVILGVHGAPVTDQDVRIFLQSVPMRRVQSEKTCEWVAETFMTNRNSTQSLSSTLYALFRTLTEKISAIFYTPTKKRTSFAEILTEQIHNRMWCTTGHIFAEILTNLPDTYKEALSEVLYVYHKHL